MFFVLVQMVSQGFHQDKMEHQELVCRLPLWQYKMHTCQFFIFMQESPDLAHSPHLLHVGDIIFDIQHILQISLVLHDISLRINSKLFWQWFWIGPSKCVSANLDKIMKLTRHYSFGNYKKAIITIDDRNTKVLLTATCTCIHVLIVNDLNDENVYKFWIYIISLHWEEWRVGILSPWKSGNLSCMKM